MPETEQTLVVGPDGHARPPWAATDPLMRDYYDTEWGVAVYEETALFEQLSLEVFQAGLSWRTILAKRRALREAFSGFNPDVVATYREPEISDLLSRPQIIRNRRKIEATIINAAAVIALRPNGGLSELLWSFPGLPFRGAGHSACPHGGRGNNRT